MVLGNSVTTNTRPILYYYTITVQ